MSASIKLFSPLSTRVFLPRHITPIISIRHRVGFVPSYSISSPSKMQTASASTISEVITKDHRELEQYYNEVINSDDVDHQKRFGNQFTWELARHSVAEELLIYPAMEKYLGKDGHEHAEKDREQHHKIKQLLKEFQNMNPAGSDYVPKLKELWVVLHEHIKEEEADDLPALEKALSSNNNRGDSESLAKNFGRTKAFVPTRSHPSAGEKPLFEGPMGMLAAPIDRIADMFRKFPESTDSTSTSFKK